MTPFSFFTPDEIEALRLKLAWPGDVTFARVNFSALRLEIDLEGEEIVARKYLKDLERRIFFQFKRKERRVEWLAGRVAAKYAAISLQDENMRRFEKNCRDCQILTESNGRPYIGPENNYPDISISHSGPAAVAMACNTRRCGIDIQEISDKIFRVKEKFARADEISLYQQGDQTDNINFGEFLTLLWSAKEALRKGIKTVPIAGFLELQLVNISGDLPGGIIFSFTFTRATKDEKNTTFKTYNILTDNLALAFFLGNPQSLQDNS